MSRLQTSAGFTLLELLVVLTLIGVISGLAVLSVDLAGPDRVVEEEIRRLALLLDEQCEEAILDSRELGLRLTSDGYRFSQWTGEEWAEYLSPPTFRNHRLPGGFHWRLELEGAEVLIEDDPARYDPHVICFSSGEMTPFELALWGPSGDIGQGLIGERRGGIEISGWLDEG